MSGVIFLLVVVVAYGLVASRLDRAWISAPMVFVAAGWAAGPEGVSLFDVGIDSHVVTTFTEITLAALLFSDATTVRLREAGGDAGLPGRLLLVGLPLTIIAGTAVGMLVTPQFGWAAAALVASVLAPTDAALGMAVVTDRAVPARIRRALNVESGLNDGVATAFVTLFLAALLSEEGIEPGSWAVEATLDIGFGVLAALVVGGVGGLLLAKASRRGWTSGTSERLCVLGLGILAYFAAEHIGGNGFVSAFTAGMIFGAVGKPTRSAMEFTDEAATYASLVVWVIFGALFVGPVVAGTDDLSVVVYALCSLTIVRIVPVAIATVGKGFKGTTSLFMGWFGPRGLASVVFTLLVVNELRGTGVDVPVFQVATWTILLSVFLHGITARPLAAAYGRSMRSGDPSAPELRDAPAPRVRRDPTAAPMLDAGSPPSAT